MIITWFKNHCTFWVGVMYVVVLSIIAKIVDFIEMKMNPGFQMNREEHF